MNSWIASPRDQAEILGDQGELLLVAAVLPQQAAQQGDLRAPAQALLEGG